VVADFTLTIGCAKQGMLADRAASHVGRLAVLRLAGLPEQKSTVTDPALVATADQLAALLPRRPFDLHKGQCGRVGIIAGSPGFTGAALMCSEAAVRAGAGLVTLYATVATNSLLADTVIPEVMVQRVASYRDVPVDRHDVLAVGPGLGRSHAEDMLRLIKHAHCPMVLDADGLNILATEPAALESCAGERLLTPHPGEMARLDPESIGRPRRETVRAFTERYPVTLLLKGSRTLVGQLGCMFSYNTTGSPGMASGGMGDVLTGVCAALVGQGLNLYSAARVGAWVCGRAAEIAILRGGESEESLCATALLRHLGAAFEDLRGHVY
jgi:NAD(P)H-hydrate epimerase